MKNVRLCVSYTQPYSDFDIVFACLLFSNEGVHTCIQTHQEGKQACVFYIYNGSGFLGHLLGFPLGRESLDGYLD